MNAHTEAAFHQYFGIPPPAGCYFWKARHGTVYYERKMGWKESNQSSIHYQTCSYDKNKSPNGIRISNRKVLCIVMGT